MQLINGGAGFNGRPAGSGPLALNHHMKDFPDSDRLVVSPLDLACSFQKNQAVIVECLQSKASHWPWKEMNHTYSLSALKKKKSFVTPMKCQTK